MKTTSHSTLTQKGQTTIPGAIRKALNLRPGDRIEYEIEGDHAIVRVHPGTHSLKGALATDEAKGLSFAEIRRRAALVAINAWRKRNP